MTDSDIKSIGMVSIPSWWYNNCYSYYPISVTTLVYVFVRLKILWFTKKLFLIFQAFKSLPLKSILIFSSVPISEVSPKFSHEFQEIIIKILKKKIVFNVFKTFLTFL